MASCDPMESPSGRACDDSTKRCRVRIAPTISCIAGLLMILRRVRRRGRRLDLVEEPLDAVLSGDRLVVVKMKLGSATQAQTRSDLAAQKRRRASERAFGAVAGLLVAESREVDARPLQIRRHLHARDGHEADAGAVDLARGQ